MGIKIEKIGTSSSELAEMQRINSENLKTKEAKEPAKPENAEAKKEGEVKLDAYNKHTVSDSIEKQINEQKAKIEELQKNLEGLREDYNVTSKALDEARKERYVKELSRHQKEVSEHSLMRLFHDWKAKFLRDREDQAIRRFYRTSYFNHETALDEARKAEIAYDIADMARFEAMAAHNRAFGHYLGGLWVQRDAYWDLAALQRRHALAKLQESLLRRF